MGKVFSKNDFGTTAFPYRKKMFELYCISYIKINLSQYIIEKEEAKDIKDIKIVTIGKTNSPIRFYKN